MEPCRLSMKYSSLLLGLRNATAFVLISCFCVYTGTRWASGLNAAAGSSIEHSLPDKPSAWRPHISVRLVEDLTEALSEASTSSYQSATNASPTHLFLGLLKGDGGIDEHFLAVAQADSTQEDPLQQHAEELEDFVEKEPAGVSSDAKRDDAKAKILKFDTCSSRWTEYIPCLDNAQAIRRLPSTARGEQYERHCPKSKRTRMCCLIAAPEDWKPPIKWPRSRDEIWYSNVPHKRLVTDKGGQNWIAIEKDKFVFPGGGTQFAHGADEYLDQMEKMVPDLAFGVRTRVALDVGCGVASWGGYLLSRNVLTLSIAPKDVHENQIQFALERGIPAMVAVLATRRLNYPSHAFELVHCSRCRINWTRDGGILLLEVDRLLRGGGYFAWAAQPVYKQGEDHQQAWQEMEALVKALCWTLVAKEHFLAIWQKPVDNSCVLQRVNMTPPVCNLDDDPNVVWYAPLKPCITLLPNNGSGQSMSDWPARLSQPPERLQMVPMDAGEARAEVFLAEQRYWHAIVEGYLRGLGIKKDLVRNVMDLNAGYGGFAAALLNQKMDWWVMNVVPTSLPNSLPVIYDRGLIGVMHDWCEPFDTYPRTYDLLHAVGLFSSEQKRCNIAQIVIEMDRILRPGGWVLIREPKAVAEQVQLLAKSVKWRTRLWDTESGPYGRDKLLTGVKQKWRP